VLVAFQGDQGERSGSGLPGGVLRVSLLAVGWVLTAPMYGAALPSAGADPDPDSGVFLAADPRRDRGPISGRFPVLIWADPDRGVWRFRAGGPYLPVGKRKAGFALGCRDMRRKRGAPLLALFEKWPAP
jgi:hypothetical protein